MSHSFIRQCGLAAITATVLIQSPRLRASEADDQIESSFKDSYVFRNFLAEDSVKIEAKDGIVELRGSVASDSHKVLAQKELTGEYASDIKGVNSVDNQMTVSEESVVQERTKGEKIDDASITAQVKMVLKSRKSTSEADIYVVTVNGEVTLTGIAKNPAEKALASKVVSDINGVEKVNNEMTIAVALAE